MPAERQTDTLIVDPATGTATVSRAGIALAAPSIAIAVAHALNDSYTAFIHPLLPRIMDKLGLSITLAASLVMILSLSASITQPVMGHLADRYGRRPLVILGPVCAGVFLSLIGFAPSFWILALLLAFGGLGSAAFHPAAASLAARIGVGKGSGARFSVFSFGGSIGYAVGPLAAVALASAFGLQMLWLAMIPMLIFAYPLWRMIPAEPLRGASDRAQPSPPILKVLRGPIGLLFGVSAASTFVQRSFITLEPIAVNAAGGSEALGAFIISIYLGSQAVGTIVGGFLTDRMDRRRLMVAITLLSLPAHALAIALPMGSIGALLSAAAAGFLYMALFPPIVVSAQELMPEGTGVSSGIVMGLAWAAASVGVLGAGAMGDILGARSAALLATPVLLIATACAAHPLLGRKGRG